MEQLRAHHQIVVEEVGRVGAVGANAADGRGQVNDQRRPGVAQQVADGLALAQVIVLAQGHEDAGRFAPLQRDDDVAAQEARAAGDDDALLAPIDHDGISSSAASCRTRSSICSRLTTISIATRLWPPPGMMTSA